MRSVQAGRELAVKEELWRLGKEDVKPHEGELKRQVVDAAPLPMRALLRRAVESGKGDILYFIDKPPPHG